MPAIVPGHRPLGSQICRRRELVTCFPAVQTASTLVVTSVHLLNSMHISLCNKFERTWTQPLLCLYDTVLLSAWPHHCIGKRFCSFYWHHSSWMPAPLSLPILTTHMTKPQAIRAIYTTPQAVVPITTACMHADRSSQCGLLPTCQPTNLRTPSMPAG